MRKLAPYIIALLAFFLAGLLFVNHRQEQRRAARMQQLQQEARPYEQELSRIRTELQQQEHAAKDAEEVTGLLFGFVPTGPADFDEIDVLASAHGITPVIILNCASEQAALTALWEAAAAKDYEVVLAAFRFDEAILQTADEMKAQLSQPEDTAAPVFLLRSDADTKENRSLFKAHGFTELIVYDEALQAGLLEDGTPYLCYGFFHSPSSYSSYISQLVSAQTMLLAAFDLSQLQGGTFQLEDIDHFLTMADARKAAGELRYVNLKDAFQTVADQNASQQRKQETLAEYKAAQEARIEALEETIGEIYSRWDAD